MISVVVPFLNEEKYIERCIHSLLEQDFNKDEYELIFIDNGSTDRSMNIVRQFPEIVLLQESKRNVYAARNKGLKIAKGEIIAFTDADCVVSKNWLTQICKGVRDTGADIVLGERYFNSKCTVHAKYFADYENIKIRYVLNKMEKKNYFGFTNNMAIRAKVFNEIGSFDEIPVTGDTELMHKYLLKFPDPKIVYLSQMRIEHLEIKTMRDWLKKQYLYGEHNLIIEKIHKFQRLDISTKLKIFNYCAKENKHTFWKRIIFFICLLMGEGVYVAGRAKGNIKNRL